MVDIANATVAGGVAVGSSADLVIGPGAAILVGFIGGVVSCIGYIHLTPYLEKRFGLTDTCGVLNLHGTPGVIGSLAGMISAGAADSTLYGKEFSDVFPHGEDQWAYQLAGLFTTIGVMGLSGLIVGAVVKRLTTARPKDEMYGDSGSFEIETAEYQMINKWEEEEESLSHEQIAEA
jgi:ammonium transporter Rh